MPLVIEDVSMVKKCLLKLIPSKCRQKLRKLEVAIIEYRESLEERGIKNHVEIETRVALQRKKLEADYGLLDNNALPSWERDSKGLDSGLDRGYSGASGKH